MIFKCDPNLRLYANGWYDYHNLSAAVGYWVDFLQKRKSSLPIGVLVTGSITFSGVAFLLALYQTKTDFVYLPIHFDYVNNKLSDLTDLEIESMVLIGSDKTLKILPLTVCTEDFYHAFHMSAGEIKSPLEFLFDPGHVIFSLTSGSTGIRKLIKTTAAKEARSIQSAIDNYFDPDDSCLFSHEMSHKGVHTSAILPALFSVKKIFLLTTQEWPRFIDQATHCQWFATMRDYYKLTPNLKKITLGGSKLSQSTAEYILSQSPDAIIYDIYGLTESLPPVAIRKITKNSFPDQFEICQADLHVKTIANQLIIVDDITNEETATGDIVKQIDHKHFAFIGRHKKEIRINENLINLSDISLMLEKEFSADSFSINIDDETLIIQTTNDTSLVNNWCVFNKVENFKITQVATITTSGGIKTINQ